MRAAGLATHNSLSNHNLTSTFVMMPYRRTL